jgi:ribosomal protein S18 acetylase RimI-like enzyme
MLPEVSRETDVVPEPRPYRDAADWEKLRHILMEGRRANNGTYYVHVGDLDWWMYYHVTGAPFSEDLWLWEEAGEVRGWVVFTPEERVLDLFIQPALRAAPEAAHMHDWAEAHLARLVKARDGNEVGMMWIFETDRVRRQFLEGRGYARKGQGMIYFTQPLAGGAQAPSPPEGFAVRGCRGEAEVEARARAQYGAFQSKWEWARYLARFQRFMRSPVYAPERDLVVLAPDGRVGAFCIFWLDPVNKVGLFEPVGTHPDFQKKGLGKAVMREGLHRMRAHGMESAIVCAEAENAAAVKLYTSVGFTATNRLCTYAKSIT